MQSGRVYRHNLTELPLLSLCRNFLNFHKTLACCLFFALIVYDAVTAADLMPRAVKIKEKNECRVPHPFRWAHISLGDHWEPVFTKPYIGSCPKWLSVVSGSTS